jgi:hypothetical protein
MRSFRSVWLNALALGALFVSASASAQVVVQGEVVAQPTPQGGGQVQGQVVIQDATPQTAYTQPTVPEGYAQSQGYVVQPQPIATCPAPAQLMPDRWGRQRCMREVTARRVSGGLVGGGAGVFGGGYVLQVFVTLFSGVVGAFSTGPDYTSEQLSNYVSWGFVPVLGPWVQMAFAPPFADASLYAVLALEGLLQAGGITMMVFGFIGSDVTEWRPISSVDLEVRPMLGHAQGLTATLRF